MDIASLVPNSNRLDVYFSTAGFGPGSISERTGRAYRECYAAGFVGAFCDLEGQPDWARQIDSYFRDQFLEQAPYAKFTEHASPIQGLGERVARTCNWNFASRLIENAYVYRQDYGSCVFASTASKTVPQLLATRILGMRKPEHLAATGSLAYYANRGHCGQGSSLAQCARDYLKGIPLRLNYLNGKYDLREENRDESLAQNSWCRDGVPDELQAEFDDAQFLTISYADDISWEIVSDALAAGGVWHTGSSTTASGDGDPVSPGTTRIGAHAQTVAGYDDSQEFRDWYQQTTSKTLTEPVLFMQQTWGPGWIRVNNWPTHLWGRRPEGMAVLRWSDARKYFGTAFAYMPDANGYQALPVAWNTAP